MDPLTLTFVLVAAAIIAHLKTQGVSASQVDAVSTQLPTAVPSPSGGVVTAGGGGGAAPPAPSALPSVSAAPGAGGWQPSAVACNGSTFARVWIRAGVIYLNGTPINISGDASNPLSGNFLKCAINGRGTVVAVFQDTNGGAHLITSAGVNTVPCGTVGNYPCGVRVLADDSFQMYVFTASQPTPGNLVGGLNIIPIDPSGASVGGITPTANDPATGAPIVYTSQGFAAGIDASGSPLWTDSHRSFSAGGHAITLPVTVGDVTIGQANEGDPGIVAWKQSTQQFFRVFTGDVQIAPTAALRSDGAIDVGITCDPGGFYPLSSWTGAVPVAVPPIDPGTHPSFLGSYPSGTMAHANCGIVFGTGLVRKPDGAKLCDWCDTESDQQKGMSITASIAQYPSPKIVYWGSRPADTPPPAEFWAALGPGDRVAFPLYRNQGEDIRTYEIAGRNNGTFCTQNGRNYVIVGGFWTRGFLSENQVLETGPSCRRLMDWPGCDGLVIFGLNRGTSIGQFLPSFQTLADEFTADGLPALGGPTGGTNQPAPSSNPPAPPPPTVSAYTGPEAIKPPMGIDWIRANFCNLTDGQGIVMFTVGLLTWFVQNNQAKWRDWIDRLKAAGSTHVFVSPQWSYIMTPPYPVPGADVRSQPDQWRAFLLALRNEGLWPVCFMSGASEGRGEIDTYWPGLFNVMQDLQDQVIMVPAWEPIPGTSWSPDDLNYAIGMIHTHLPTARIHFHSSPDRSTGCGKDASEGPDPWNHDEAGFWSNLNGVFLSGLIYETGHDDYVLAQIVAWATRVQGACGGGVTLYPTTQTSYLNRWSEVVYRSVLGQCAWRRVFVCIGETVASNYIRGGCTDADARRVARDAGRVAAWLTGQPVGYGNGLPDGF